MRQDANSARQEVISARVTRQILRLGRTISPFRSESRAPEADFLTSEPDFREQEPPFRASGTIVRMQHAAGATEDPSGCVSLAIDAGQDLRRR